MSSEKQRLVIILAVLAFVSITLPVLTPRSYALSTSSTEPRMFTIIVSRNGFNGTADSLSMTVQQGEAVNITFLYGDNDLPVDNPHAIMIDGYGIKTANIDRANPMVTVE